MAKIGLWSDCHNFPSLPLMKLAAYHRSIGDTVEMYSPFSHYDRVYASKTFSFTPAIDDEYAVRSDELIKGGTGYCISIEGGKEIFDNSKNNRSLIRLSIFILTTSYIPSMIMQLDF